MRVRDHVLTSTAATVLAAPFLGRGAVGLLAGGVLIDADHYAWFCLRYQRLNPLAAVRFFNQADPPQHQATRALHAPAALLAAALLGARFRRLLPVAMGMILHAALDAHHVASMGRARSAALVRDGYSCQMCGTTTPPVGTHLRRQPALLPSYRVQNQVSLCGQCHETAHSRARGATSWI